ncbi:unnamed protein product [Dicrocoelium dendriticum]|nr:unnamed protein product [Dicrocoelium dendriticum]
MQERINFMDFNWDTYDLKNKTIRFTNCFILQGEELISDYLWIRDGVIADGLSLFYTHKLTADITIDAGGAVIAPGFIDIQVNGAYGHDFSNPELDTCEVCREVALRLPHTGVTAFCPTIITSDKQTYTQIISRFAQYVDQPNCAQMLGLHLEGPFISKLRRGMHPKNRILEFGPDPVKTLLDTYGRNLDIIRIVTIAPEIDGSSGAITELISCGVVVSIGHTDADCKALERAIASGATLLTHLFNAMPMFHHRHSHLLGGIIKPLSSLHVGIIADLVHVHPAALRLADALAPRRVILVTDANTAFGLGDGSYTFGEQNIEVIKGVAYVTGTDCLAGGTTALSVCVRNYWLEVCQHNTQQSENQCGHWRGLGQALAAASTRPARVLGLYQRNMVAALAKGTLEPGADADLTIICPNSLRHTTKPTVKILSTWIAGKPVFTDPAANLSVTAFS